MDKEAAYFKVLSDPTRLRLAVLLAIQGETCVCHLSGALNEPEYKISRHLGIMRNGGIVQARREGTWMYYQLSPASNDLESCLLSCFGKCFANHPTTQADMKRLSNAACSPVTAKEKAR